MRNNKNISKEDIERCINRALDLLYENDEYLIMHGGIVQEDHVSERGIVFRFGVYFDWLFRQSISRNYHIDAEYNRDIYEKKQMPKQDNPEEMKNCYPDFIVHRRGRNDNNLLILEFKTWWNKDQNEDKNRVQYFIDPKNQYKYQFGATVLLEKQREKCVVSWE